MVWPLLEASTTTSVQIRLNLKFLGDGAEVERKKDENKLGLTKGDRTCDVCLFMIDPVGPKVQHKLTSRLLVCLSRSYAD